MFDGDDDAVEDAYDFDLGQEFLEDAAAAWQHMNRPAAGVGKAPAPQARPGPSPTNGRSAASRQFSDDLASSNQQAPYHQDRSTSPAGAQDAAAADGLPQIHKLLHNNPSCYEDSSKGWKQRNAKSGPDYAVPATAAVGGLVALTGSLISYAVARARSSRREQRLKEGLQRKEKALKAMQTELEALKSTAQRMVQLEVELASSNTHLMAMNQEVERARAASKRIEGDMALFHDQLHQLSTTEAEIKAAMTAAEVKAIKAEQRQQEAEVQRQQAEARWQAARQQLEQTQTEVETLKGELGLRGSQLQGLTRELEFTRRQLANAEKCVERAQMQSRQQRSGFGSYDAVPDWE